MRIIKEVLLVLIVLILLVFIPFQIITSPSYEPGDIIEQLN